MSRIETITTKVRPIKKLCIIDNDFGLFCHINNVFTEEIGGFYNLILLNDDKLFSQNTLDFIKYHDPDIIINYSKRENELLLEKFKIRVIDPKAKENFNLGHYTIPISVLDNIPDLAKSVFLERVKKIILCNSNSKKPENSVNFVNLGSYSVEEENNIKRNPLFQGIEIDNAPIRFGNLNIFKIRENNSNILYINNLIYRPYPLDSVFTINNNQKGYFYQKPAIIFGNPNELDSIIYFWNTRATYPYSELFWISIESFDEYLNQIKQFSNFCIFSESDELREKLKQICEKFEEINPDRYYFNGSYGGWDCFEYLQNIAFNDDHVRIIHPQEKLFSKSGFNVNIALEINGIEETILPQSTNLGRLFKEDNPHSKQYFAKVGSRGFAILLEKFVPYEESPLSEILKIPSEIQIFNGILAERDLTYNETKNSQVTKQVINLLGGYDNIEILKDEVIYDLIVEIAPKRIERIVKDLSIELKCKIDDEILEELIKEKFEDIAPIKSEPDYTVDDFYSRAGGYEKIKDKKSFQSNIEKLYSSNLLLRGKGMLCKQCGSRLWYPISDLKDDLKCYCCNNSLRIPIYNEEKALKDSFKLNQLICNAVDQGVLPVLLTSHLIHHQKWLGIRLMFDVEILEKNEPIGEIDILFTFGKKIGISEVKADRGFEENQIDRILNIREKLRADFIIFSTLKGANSTEVNQLITYLELKEIDYPIFILTKEILFNEKIIDIGKYFYVDQKTKSYPKGVIIPSFNSQDR
ncbi:hypothetical protein [Methanolacinia paynteri]|uniref:hypothetical protein n=1 Tax=Methanolacinia paynteri TaxID=230356 RepID=UPI00064E4CBF|nr:hypothetical protein [Methanolacinia paynteri]